MFGPNTNLQAHWSGQSKQHISLYLSLNIYTPRFSFSLNSHSLVLRLGTVKMLRRSSLRLRNLLSACAHGRSLNAGSLAQCSSPKLHPFRSPAGVASPIRFRVSEYVRQYSGEADKEVQAMKVKEIEEINVEENEEGSVENEKETGEEINVKENEEGSVKNEKESEEISAENEKKNGEEINAKGEEDEVVDTEEVKAKLREYLRHYGGMTEEQIEELAAKADSATDEPIRYEDFEPEIKIFEDPILDREPPPEPDEQTKRDVAALVETLKKLVEQMPVQKPRKKVEGHGRKGNKRANEQ